MKESGAIRSIFVNNEFYSNGSKIGLPKNSVEELNLTLDLNKMRKGSKIKVALKPLILDRSKIGDKLHKQYSEKIYSIEDIVGHGGNGFLVISVPIELNPRVMTVSILEESVIDESPLEMERSEFVLEPI
ncbi:hypothetical protein [Pseudoalteromonas sp. S2755]|uniref:hypothetical protein n=1 Tax=Pseudoalteromonas sp. S2755 TaxID=2066523 RepID=UPI00110BBA38|nr:hypothetical protein [Pseudoalteromonas sp. S2755]TMN44848.1 hypothetical protein CWC03_03125 [Pseudoalteromonas sp. S2755]